MRRGPEVSQRLPKRLRSDPSAEGHCPDRGQNEKMRPKGHKLSPVGLGNVCHANPGWMNLTTLATELIKSSGEVQGGKPCFILIGFHNRSVNRKYTFCQFLDFTNQGMMTLICSLLCNRFHAQLVNEPSFFLFLISLLIFCLCFLIGPRCVTVAESLQCLFYVWDTLDLHVT